MRNADTDLCYHLARVMDAMQEARLHVEVVTHLIGETKEQDKPTYAIEQVKAAFYQTMGGGYQSDTVDLWWLAMEQNLRNYQQGGGKG